MAEGNKIATYRTGGARPVETGIFTDAQLRQLADTGRLISIRRERDLREHRRAWQKR